MREQYLLRRQWQIDAFRARYAKFIENNSDRFLKWFLGLPLYEWVKIPFNDRTMEAGIGLLCLLYIDGKINLMVDKTITYVQRQALTEDEYQEWAKQHFKNLNTIKHY